MGHLLTWVVHLSVSYLFAFSYFLWCSQGKNTEVVCHSFLQWTMFCQNSPPLPVCLGWPYMAWLLVHWVRQGCGPCDQDWGNRLLEGTNKALCAPGPIHLGWPYTAPSSFFLEVFLHWSPVAYWAPTDLWYSTTIECWIVQSLSHVWFLVIP